MKEYLAYFSGVGFTSQIPDKFRIVGNCTVVFFSGNDIQLLQHWLNTRNKIGMAKHDRTKVKNQH